jgi:NADH-quinone oxidoreductase subunit N
MIISSAFSSGLLLFGISLVYGATGTLNFGVLGTSFTF